MLKYGSPPVIILVLKTLVMCERGTKNWINWVNFGNRSDEKITLPRNSIGIAIRREN